MADIVNLQVTERVKRIGDKENSIINLVNWGTVLCRYITVIYYYSKLNTPSVGTRLLEYLWFIYSLSGDYMVHLWPIGRPYM
jgi:hypothetical protein